MEEEQPERQEGNQERGRGHPQEQTGERVSKRSEQWSQTLMGHVSMGVDNWVCHPLGNW